MAAVLIQTFGKIHFRNYKGALLMAQAVKQSFQGDVLMLGVIDSPERAVEFIRAADTNRNVIAFIIGRHTESAYTTLAYLAPESISIHPKKIRFLLAEERPMTPKEWQQVLDNALHRVHRKNRDPNTTLPTG